MLQIRRLGEYILKERVETLIVERADAGFRGTAQALQGQRLKLHHHGFEPGETRSQCRVLRLGQHQAVPGFPAVQGRIDQVNCMIHGSQSFVCRTVPAQGLL